MSSTALWKRVGASQASQRTNNPIRAIVDVIKADPKHPKKMIALSIGDPTIDGNLLPPQNAIDAICNAARSGKYNGYAPTFGYEDARAAVAEYVNKEFHQLEPTVATKLTANDVVLACGCSHAINMTLGALCDPGDNVLVPQPGFSIYNVICNYMNVQTRNYVCDPTKNWEIDLDSVKRQVNERTKAFIVNNPSNPCGSNFNRKHLEAIVKTAEEMKVPILSDEIYAGMTFGESSQHPAPPYVAIANISKTVPCLVVGGAAKNYVAPGYRVGWVYRHDPGQVLTDVFPAITKMSQLTLGPSTLLQAGLRSILLETDELYHRTLRGTLADNAARCYNKLLKVRDAGLEPVRPSGAMYMMVRVDLSRFDAEATGIKDDVSFAAKLMLEENVQVLPGTIFKAPGFVRIVFTRPGEVLDEAIDRIVCFVERHSSRKSKV